MNLSASFKSITRILILVAVVATGPGWSVVYSQSLKTPASAAQLVEEFSFLIKDFRMDHQGQANNLNISISYRYAANISKADYPDFRWLAKDIETLLSNYPNEDDYWEIVNKQITALLLKKYPGIASVTSEIKVDPTSAVLYTRSSRVTRERSASKARKHQ
ncbi:MAG TPA: hypothetical protein VGQ41_19400 [Pyrinomonadaceae bacterium]|jgi:hypothetical protein|nr:hypothetical protein [Pyrinomonadaceae bacterium]